MSRETFLLGQEEPAYFKLFIEKNIVNKVEILTTFIKDEKSPKSLFAIEQLCSLSSNNNAFVYMMALEKIAGIELSRRTEYLRVIVDEVIRVSSHMFNLAILSHLVGFHINMALTMKTRDLMQEIKEIIWGSKIDCSFTILGGVKHDINNNQRARILKIIEELEPKVEELIYIYENDEKIKNSTVGVGVLSNKQALRLGVTGPVARASGINNDIRVNAPYSIYKELNPIVILKQEGDVYSRMLVRCGEIQESIRMIKQAINSLPEGKIILEEQPYINIREAVTRIEAPRGELLCYLKTSSKETFSRIRWRTPTYMNWEVLKVIIPQNKVSKVSLIVNSIDPCLSCLSTV